MRAWFLLLGLAGCAHSAVPYHVQEIEAPAPSLPPLCGSAEPCDGAERWVIFYSRYCGECHELLREIARRAEDLEASGICLSTYLLQEGACPGAMRIASKSGGLPVGLADERVVAAWGVDSAPILYVVRDGAVRVRVRGRAGVDDLLRL